MVTVERGGKLAMTRYRVIGRHADASLVEVDIQTGRSHQIRVHFADAGHPLLGDTAYGGPAMCGGVPLPRQMLHASELLLDHPVTGETLHLRAGVPPDFEMIVKSLSLSL
jgi:23S rRNA pseudouridine1911/1915/1917 synthase